MHSLGPLDLLVYSTSRLGFISPPTRMTDIRPLPLPEDIQLIVSDVDSTLLDSQHKLHPKTFHALQWLRTHKPELPIVIATGKQRPSVQEIRDPLNLSDFPACHLNGCIVYGPQGKILKETGLDKNVVLQFHQQFTAAGVSLFLYDRASVYEFQGTDGPLWGDRLRGYGENVKPGNASLIADIESGKLKIIKAAVCQEEARLGQSRMWLQAYREGGFTLTQALPFYIEIIPATASKGIALTHLLGNTIDPKGVLAFGDGENDVSMFKVAGYAVAVGNAMEIAKAHSTHVTASSDEGGGELARNTVKLLIH